MNFITNELSIDPIIKWPGGKQDELNIILPRLPKFIDRYFEPFLGGGALYLSIPSDVQAFVNDKSEDLINLYEMISKQDEDFLLTLDLFIEYGELLEILLEANRDILLNSFSKYMTSEFTDAQMQISVRQFIESILNSLIKPLKSNLSQDIPFFVKTVHHTLFEKTKRMRKLSLEKGHLIDGDICNNFEAALKASFYYYLRHLYNYSSRFHLSASIKASLFFFIRENAYASMFRFNKSGHFNIPYGGITYNRKNLRAKVMRLQSPMLIKRLRNTYFGNADFEDFLKQISLRQNDFIFLDPPYDTEFSSYDQNPFGKEDQQRLADFLINACPANFMLVIKNTPFILSLYEGYGLNIDVFDKKYMYTIKERNNRDVEHLLITNYSEL